MTELRDRVDTAVSNTEPWGRTESFQEKLNRELQQHWSERAGEARRHARQEGPARRERSTRRMVGRLPRVRRVHGVPIHTRSKFRSDALLRHDHTTLRTLSSPSTTVPDPTHSLTH